MEKNYVFKVNGSLFESKEELVEYVLENFVDEREIDEEGKEVFNKLKEAFPFAQLNIQYKNDVYGKYLVEMRWKSSNAEFEFYVGKGKDVNMLVNQFRNVEEAIKWYDKLLKIKRILVKRLKNEYNAEKVNIRIFDKDFYANAYLDVRFKVENVWYDTSFDVISDTINGYFHSLKGFFDKTFEGEVKKKRGSYHVDDIPVHRILDRAKKIKLEVLE